MPNTQNQHTLFTIPDKGWVYTYQFRGAYPTLYITPNGHRALIWKTCDEDNRLDHDFHPQMVLVLDKNGQLEHALIPADLDHGLWYYPDMRNGNPGPDDPPPLKFDSIEAALITMDLLY